MLSTSRSSNVPMVIGFNGEYESHGINYFTIPGNYDDDIKFTFGPDTEVEASCVSSFNGEMWVFGGTYHLRQVSGSYDRENGENNIFFVIILDEQSSRL